MNCDNGHLVRANFLADLPDQEQYIPVPDYLERAASIKLAGRQEAKVSLTSGGKLARFAAATRKSKRKMQNQSRKNNR